MKAPSSVKGCGGADGLEPRAVVPPGIPDGLFPPVDITVHSISTRHRSRRPARIQADSVMRGRVASGIRRANIPLRQQSPVLHSGSREDASDLRGTRSTGIDGRHGYAVSRVGRTGRPIEDAKLPRLGRPNCLRPRFPTHVPVARKGATPRILLFRSAGRAACIRDQGSSARCGVGGPS